LRRGWGRGKWDREGWGEGLRGGENEREERGEEEEREGSEGECGRVKLEGGVRVGGVVRGVVGKGGL